MVSISQQSIESAAPNSDAFKNGRALVMKGKFTISDHGKPSYNADLADELAKLGMPCVGCHLDRLLDLLAAVVKGCDLKSFASHQESTSLRLGICLRYKAKRAGLSGKFV